MCTIKHILYMSIIIFKHVLNLYIFNIYIIEYKMKDKCHQECGEIETFLDWGGECKILPSL
jgi:hypothetical protein